LFATRTGGSGEKGDIIMNSALVGFGFFYIIFILAIIGFSIYWFILLVKLARRGIKALDIYINEKTNKQF
jgi:hypothetical protein